MHCRLDCLDGGTFPGILVPDWHMIDQASSNLDPSGLRKLLKARKTH